MLVLTEGAEEEGQGEVQTSREGDGGSVVLTHSRTR
jgi:hypothetical protein